MNSIQLFSNPRFGQIRTAGTSDEPLFCLADICKVLDLNNTSQVKTRLNSKGMQLIDLQCLFNNDGVIISELGNTKATFISEPNLYKCIFQSRKPDAEEFQDWVTSEVLPSIRKHGGYIIEKESDSEEDLLARAFLIAQNKLKEREQRVQMLEGENELLQSKNKMLAPKAEYTDTVLQSLSTYTMTQVAKEFGLSAVALEKKLKDMGVMFRQSGQWLLYAKYAGEGYTKPRTHHYTHSDGSTGTNTITVWTEKGRAFIHSLIKQLKSA